jgi:hypothetical protein
MVTVMRVVALALLVFGIYVSVVYGAPARRIVRRAGIPTRAWDRGADALLAFCALAGRETRPWRGRVLRDARRMILAGLLAAVAGWALLMLSLFS